jgi:hypothetical protein
VQGNLHDRGTGYASAALICNDVAELRTTQLP